MRVGVVGGTFDPIHYAHLLIAEEARLQLDLEEVIFVPTGQPWMKVGRSISAPHHRLNMVRIAISSNPFFRVSSMEIDRPGPTYTVDTLEQMRQEQGDTGVIYLILGLDSLTSFPRWKEPDRILEMCTLVAVPRPGYQNGDLSFLDSIHPQASKDVVMLKGPEVGISGTEIRRRVADRVSTRYHLPENVERYMYGYRLYTDQEVSR